MIDFPYKVIAVLCGLFAFFYPELIAKSKKYNFIIRFFAVLAIVVPFFIPLQSNKTVINTGLSDDHIKKIVKQAVEEFRQEAEEKYPISSAFYGIHGNKLFAYGNSSNKNLVEVNWNNGHINYTTKSEIEIKMPDIYFKKEDVHLNLRGGITIPKIVGFKFDGIGTRLHKLCIEVKSIIDDVVIIEVGIVKK